VFVDDGHHPAMPTAATIVQPGDAITLGVWAPPGSTVSASGPGFGPVPLAPLRKTLPGTYGARVAAPRTTAPAAGVAYRIVDPSGQATVVLSGAQLKVSQTPVLFVGQIVSYRPDALSGHRPYGMLGPTPD